MDGSSVSLIAWLIAGVCFILSLGGLSQHETSQRGNWLGIIGITIAILATLFSGQIGKIVSHGTADHSVQTKVDAEADTEEQLPASVNHKPGVLIYDGAGLGLSLIHI